jgi:DNA-binding transcriptional LysR family regulator
VDLSGEPWIGGAPTSAWYRIVGHACRLAGFAPKVGFASDDPIAIQALVAAGLGVAVIPGLAVAHPLPGLEVRTLGSGAPVRHISAARPRDGYHGPSVTAMLDSLRAAAQAVPVIASQHDSS